jgi:N-acetylneuraminate synthase
MPPFFTGEPRYAYFERTAFSPEQWHAIKTHCDERQVEFLSSPFSCEAVALLESVGVARYKVPSGEVTNLPLLEAIARTGKPVLLSSGMSSWAELDEAVQSIVQQHTNMTVLQCTSEYPCPYEHVGLHILREMSQRYSLPVGLSDHTLSNYAAFAAVTLGAAVIEKHFTFSRLMYGSDARHSLEPADFTDLVQGVRAIETMLAAWVDKDNTAPFATMKETFEKSIVALVDIPAGARITDTMVGMKKPGTGLPARRLKEVLGKQARRDIPADTLIREEDITSA